MRYCNNITYVLFYSKTNILSLQDVIITRSMFFSHICYNLLKQFKASLWIESL